MPDEIGRAVELVLKMERKLGQVDRVALEHYLMHWRLRRRHLDDRLRVVHAAHVFVDHTLRSSVPKAAASRLRLPDTDATISYCSAPTRLKYFAFGRTRSPR